MTRKEAIRKLVELDVCKWGEQERSASAEMRGKLSHGRALNSLAYYDPDNVDRALAAEAKTILTASDNSQLYGAVEFDDLA